MEFSFTRKGPGRIHNATGAERRFKDISNIHNEYDMRIKYGRVSDAFMKRWNKHFKYMTSSSESMLRKLYGKFTKLLRK